MHQQSIDTNAETGFVKIQDAYKVESSFVEEWYLPQHPALCPNKPGKLRRNCNAASNYKDVCLKDKLLSGAGLLHGLIGTIFRFHEGLKALNPDIESGFMQVEVPKQNKSCLRFLSFQETNESVEIYKIIVTCLEPRGLQLVQTFLSNEWDLITESGILLQQNQYETSTKCTILSKQKKPMKKQLKSSVSCNILSRNMDLTRKSG